MLAIDTPPAYSDLQDAITDGIDDINSAYYDIWDPPGGRFSTALVRRRNGAIRRAVRHNEAAVRRLRAKLPPVPADGPWGAPTAPVSARQAHEEYRIALENEVGLNASYLRPPTHSKRWRDWARAAARVRAQRTRMAALHPPPDARAAHRLLLDAMRAIAVSDSDAATLLRTHSRSAYTRMNAAARRGARDLDAAQERYRRAHYDVSIGAPGTHHDEDEGGDDGSPS